MTGRQCGGRQFGGRYVVLIVTSNVWADSCTCIIVLTLYRDKLPRGVINYESIPYNFHIPCCLSSIVRPELFTFSTSSLKSLNGNWQNLTGSKNLMFSTKFMLFGTIGNPRWSPLPIISWEIFYFSSDTAERNLTKLENVLYKFGFFWPIGKPRWLLRPLIGWDIFIFFSETAKWNLTKFYRKHERWNGIWWYLTGSNKDGTMYTGAQYVAL